MGAQLDNTDHCMLTAWPKIKLNVDHSEKSQPHLDMSCLQYINTLDSAYNEKKYVETLLAFH